MRRSATTTGAVLGTALDSCFLRHVLSIRCVALGVDRQALKQPRPLQPTQPPQTRSLPITSTKERNIFAEGPAGAAPSVSHTTKSSQLIYCALSGKLHFESDSDIKFAFSIGFGVSDTNALIVQLPQKLNQLAQKLRAMDERQQKKTLKFFPQWIRRGVVKILLDPQVADPAAAVQESMDAKETLQKIRRASVDIQNAVQGQDSGVKGADSKPSLQDRDLLAIRLNDEQTKAIDLVMNGFNTYIGGSAGTGKTVLIRALHRTLQEKGLRVAVTASTGIAGCHIGGSTFHHAMGATTHNEFINRENLLAFDVVIIDEVSMMPCTLFEEFDRVLRAETGNTDLPFGGIQVVLCGDFLQLSAIHEKPLLSSALFRDHFVKIKLQKQVRQADHQEFADQLSVMRHGSIPDSLFNKLEAHPPGTLVAGAVNLLPTNIEVTAANERELKRLPGEPLYFTPFPQPLGLQHRVTPTILLQRDPRSPVNFDKDVLVSKVRALMQSALHAPLPANVRVSCYPLFSDGFAVRLIFPQVIEEEWVAAASKAFVGLMPVIHGMNLGVRVTELAESPNGLHPADAEERLELMSKNHPVIQRMPLKIGCRVLLRCNITSTLVNGSIGTVTGFVKCTAENVTPSLRDERIDDLVGQYRNFAYYECGMEEPLLPQVAFHSGEEVVIPPWDFSVGGGPFTQYYSQSTVAIPLTLAYAFTVHKVQGLTLVGKVHLELSKMWPCDHLLYVAMSRVKNPDQLSISGFQPSMVKANPECVSFDESLQDVFHPEIPERIKRSTWKAIELAAERGVRVEEILHGLAGQNAANTTEASEATATTTPFNDSSAGAKLKLDRIRRLAKMAEKMIGTSGSATGVAIASAAHRRGSNHSTSRRNQESDDEEVSLSSLFNSRRRGDGNGSEGGSKKLTAKIAKLSLDLKPTA